MPKPKEINAVKVQLTTLFSLKNESLTFVPKTIIDEVNGEEYVQTIYCLEQQKDYAVAPFLTIDLLPGWIQSVFPLGRIISNPAKD